MSIIFIKIPSISSVGMVSQFTHVEGRLYELWVGDHVIVI